MSPISPDDLQKIFNNLDTNNKGHVSTNELHLLLDKIGIRTSLEELENFVGRNTLDCIDFLVFYDAMIKPTINADGHDHDVENDLLKAFKVFDLNGDGYISCHELQSVLSRLGLWEKTNGQDCKDMIGVYDENSDGLLDFQEFKNMMSVPPSSSDSD